VFPALIHLPAALEPLPMFKERSLHTELWVPCTPDQVFPFFADAANLNVLTPDWLDFRILTPLPIAMRQGALIDYRIGLKGIPMRWRTLISRWDPPHAFVDEQVKGPYLLWHHTHEFIPRSREGRDGTLCIDHVRYKHLGGPIAEALLVRKDLDRIFAYRQQKMQKLFGDPT
jgi:ligand-binding SRPBCC domain-containing protein